MSKSLPVCALLLLFVFCTSFEGQNPGALPNGTTKSGPSGVITSGSPNNSTRTIRQDRNGNTWIASSEGIIRYDGKSFANVTRTVTESPFMAVLEDSKGNFWFASMSSGVYHYDGKSFRNFTTREGLANDRVTCMYEDKTGNIWFGTPGGAIRYDGKSFRNYSVTEDQIGQSLLHFISREKQPHNEINVILEDSAGKLWFGTRGGAYVYDGNTFTPVTRNGQPFDNVRTITEDKNGNIWLGGSDGLWRYDDRTFANPEKKFTNFTRAFVGYSYADQKGNVWTSSVNPHDRSWTLSRYKVDALTGDVGPATEINVPNAAMILGIVEHADGSLWFDTPRGVYRCDGNPAGNSWKLVVAVHHGGC